MKVLLAFPQQDKQTGLSLLRGFKDNNCEVVTLDPKIEPYSLHSLTENFKPDLIFCSRTPELLSGIIKVSKCFPDILKMCWNVDSRNSVLQFGEPMMNLFRAVDVLYSKPLGNVDEYMKHCPDTLVKFLPQGVDTVSYKKEVLTNEDHKKYDCDVLFIGNKTQLHEGRIQLIESLKKRSKQGHFKLKLICYDGGVPIYDTQHNKACQCAKIVIGHTGFRPSLSNSVRDFKVLGAGGFLLTQHTEWIGRLFVPEIHVITYKTVNDCIRKIDEFKDDDSKRKIISQCGYEHVIKHHTYGHRVNQILKDFKKIKNI